MPNPATQPFRVADLSRRKAQSFVLAPSAAARAQLAAELGISAIRKLSFQGELHPEGRRDWRLEGRLGATVVQPCVVTLAPVTSRIEEPVIRRYLADWAEPEPGSEVAMPEDDSTEALGAEIDAMQVMAEALALALPAYPRAKGAELGAAIFTEPGAAPLTDEAAKPFAGLAKLKKDTGEAE